MIFLHLLGATLGLLMCVCRSRRYFYTLVNLRLCFPNESEPRIQQLAKQSLRESGKTLFEVVLALLWPKFFCGAIRKVVGAEHVLNAREQGKSIILIGPHMGNWEVLNVYLSQFNPCASYKALRHHWMDRWFRRCREFHGTRLVSIQADGLKAMCNELSKGGMIMMFPDQVPSESAGRALVPFFNIPVWTGTLVSRLAQRDNVAVICGYAKRLPRGRGYEIYLEPVPEAVYSADPTISAAALNEGLENCIQTCTEQYLWQYKRFKDNIPGVYNRNEILQPRSLL